MSDEGLSLGGAVLAWSQETGSSLYQGPVKHMFMGVSIEADITAELDKLGVVYKQLDDVPETIAQLLAEGKIIALVRGAMEFGPRALGNRSILYQANDPTVNQWLNERLKRTEFMPFAPIVRAEDADRLFEHQGLHGAEHTAEFMTICFDCTEQLREQCPAIVHIDGTARPQLVTQENQPSLHRILTRYQELTGLPALINTSFNMHEEPIVAYTQDAVIAFLQSQLDFLVIEDFLVEYHANAHALENETLAVNNIPRR
jgi:carbamoyltransferase